MAKARVLVINDDESILDLFRLILEGEGFEVYSSEEAIENITEVERIQPDLVILDLKLGVQQEGWVMMQKIRMYPPTQHIPMILCTAALNEVREQEGTLQDKGIPVVYKPFGIDELLQAVQVVLPSSDDDIRKKRKR
jgi:CheY-like chemotaxis protein